MSQDAVERTPLSERLKQPVDSAIFAYVRFALGISIFYWAASYTKLVEFNGEMVPLYDPIFLKPKFMFKYWGFEWVKLWPGEGIYWHFVATKIAALMLAAGLLTRVAAAIASFCVAYVLLVECHIYVNHYYLMSCLAALMVFLPAGRRWSIDALLGFEKKSLVASTWQLWFLRFQLGIPYFFGAIAKMNSDWLRGQPAEVWLTNWRSGNWAVDRFMQIPNAPLIFSYGGLFYDLFIVWLLLFKRTRWFGVLLSLGFHLTNSQLFSIGVFPWMMLATLIVFFPPSTIPKLLRWLSTQYSDRPLPLESACDLVDSEFAATRNGFAGNETTKRLWSFGFGLALTYVIIQLLLPIRPWVLPGNPSWNERGHRFAWRMMLRNKLCLTAFRVVAPDGAYQYFPATTVMTGNQVSNADGKPELLRQAAVQMKKLAAQAGAKDAKVYVLSLVSLNGRRPVPIVDPAVDLSVVKRGWLSDDWVLDKLGPLPQEHWPRDVEQWWIQLVLPEPFKALQGHRPQELRDLVERQRAAIQASQSKSSIESSESGEDKKTRS